MSIHLIVEDILRAGWMKLAQESTLLGAIRRRAKFSSKELQALIRLQKALQAGNVLTGERKRCVNVMEELVRDAVAEEMARRGLDDQAVADLGDVAAYALNRLPALYATTLEGYEFHRDRARAELRDAIRQRVSEAIDRSLSQPCSRPDGTPLGREDARIRLAQAVPELADPERNAPP
ncbi:MAG: late competence development ComFB family protein [Deferrisomatales bacterium]